MSVCIDGLLCRGLSALLLDSGRDADYRLCVFARTENIDGGCISGKKFFFLVDLFCSGHYNLVEVFRFQMTDLITIL